MGLLACSLKGDRKYWHVCYTCMQQAGHDTVNSVFYSEGPPVLVLGRPWMQCPRCFSSNTKSFQDLKDEGGHAEVWGMENLLKKYPRRQFEIKNPATSQSG